MTADSVDLLTIAQTFSEMQSAAQVASPTSAAPTSASFAQRLAEATDALSEGDALSGADAGSEPEGEIGSGGLSDPGGTDGELELMALLLSHGGSSVPGQAMAGEMSGSNDVSGSAVVDEASQFIGTPYVWGGTTPQGFDCSGFTQYVFGQLGVFLPRTTEQQAMVGAAVGSLADAQPGDLILFAGSDGTASAPGHVGIYVGNGNMIDAPETGSVVHVQPVSSAGPIVAIRNVLSSGMSPADTGTVMGTVTVPTQFASVVTQAAANNGIPSSLLAALLYQESHFETTAVSSAGAQGIAQFMPATAAAMGIDPNDPTQAINGAAQLLGSYTKKFGNYADALAAYNAGSSAVERYGGIPPYAETQAYVPAVLSLAGLGSAPETLA